MATTEDELAKKQVQEAVWTWAGRAIVVAVVFGFGFFAAWLLWGVGQRGAPALRVANEQLEAQLLDFKNRRVDVEGKLVVIQGRLDECNRSLAAKSALPVLGPRTPRT
ncbi:MAG: hypothetical protein E6J75_00725 [Deltaproteobacteria bacterium]|nr:MAG: hypothetical protein E6J75_00725 [Deltaproteobacteria bacterium]